METLTVMGQRAKTAAAQLAKPESPNAVML